MDKYIPLFILTAISPLLYFIFSIAIQATFGVPEENWVCRNGVLERRGFPLIQKPTTNCANLNK